MPGWMSYKLESRYADDTTLITSTTLAAKEEEEELKNLLIRVKEESERAGLRLKKKNQKTRIMASSPITAWQIEGVRWKQW